MAEISRNALFGKLNPLAYRGIESATVFCKLRGNPYVELVHWLHQLLPLQDSDLHRIVKHFQLNPSALARDVTVRNPHRALRVGHQQPGDQVSDKAYPGSDSQGQHDDADQRDVRVEVAGEARADARDLLVFLIERERFPHGSGGSADAGGMTAL